MSNSAACLTHSVKAFFSKLFKKEQPKCSLVVMLEKSNELIHKLETDVTAGLKQINDLEAAALELATQHACAADIKNDMPTEATDIETYKKLLANERAEKCKLIREHGTAIANMKKQHHEEITDLENSINRINTRHADELKKLSNDSATAILNAAKKGAADERAKWEKEASENKEVKEKIISVSRTKKATVKDDGTVERVPGQRAFTDEQVREFRHRVNVGGEKASDIANEVGVSASTIQRIISGKSYADVE